MESPRAYGSESDGRVLAASAEAAELELRVPQTYRTRKHRSLETEDAILAAACMMHNTKETSRVPSKGVVCLVGVTSGVRPCYRWFNPVRRHQRSRSRA